MLFSVGDRKMFTVRKMLQKVICWALGIPDDDAIALKNRLSPRGQ